MSENDQVSTRKPRSPINAIKLLNLLREEKGLPKVVSLSKADNGKNKLSKDEKNTLAKQVWKDLFPNWDSPSFQLNENAGKLVLVEFEKRLRELQGEGTRRGRKPKVVVQ